MHTLELFFTLSHTLPLHDSHLSTGFLNAELQANWHGTQQQNVFLVMNFSEENFFVTKKYHLVTKFIFRH